MVLTYLGNISIARQLADHVSSIEMDDNTVIEYLNSGTSFVINKTGVILANWELHEDYSSAKHASECYAAAYMVLVVSTAKDKTGRHEELLKAAQIAIDTIVSGVDTEPDDTGGDGSQFFINVNSKYKSYENNPLEVEPYKSFK